MATPKRLTAERAARMANDVLAACPDLEKLSLTQVVDMVVKDAGSNLEQLERAIDAEKGIGPELAAAFMTIGAMSEVLAGFPQRDDRRRLLEAGKVVGRVLTEQWAEKMRSEAAALISKERN